MGRAGSLCVAVILSVAGAAPAALISIRNGQFEAADAPLGGDHTATAYLGGGWYGTLGSSTAYYGVDAVDPAAYPVSMGAAGGNKVSIRFSGVSSNATRVGYIRSPALGNAAGTTSLLIQPDTRYTVTVAVGNKNTTAFPGEADAFWRNCIEFLADGRLLATRQVYPRPADGAWTDTSLYFTTDANGIVIATNGTQKAAWNDVTTIGRDVLGEPLQIRLRAETYSKAGPQVVEFDNVRLDVVPEPAAMSLLALGGLGVLVRRRRR